GVAVEDAVRTIRTALATNHRGSAADFEHRGRFAGARGVDPDRGVILHCERERGAVALQALGAHGAAERYGQRLTRADASALGAFGLRADADPVLAAVETGRAAGRGNVQQSARDRVLRGRPVADRED